MLSNAQVQRTLEQKAYNGVIATPSHVNEVPTLWTLHLKQGESSLYIGLLRNAGQDDYRKPFVGDSPYALMKQPKFKRSN